MIVYYGFLFPFIRCVATGSRYVTTLHFLRHHNPEKKELDIPLSGRILFLLHVNRDTTQRL